MEDPQSLDGNGDALGGNEIADLDQPFGDPLHRWDLNIGGVAERDRDHLFYRAQAFAFAAQGAAVSRHFVGSVADIL